jgi:hypothetical protein
VAQFAGSYGHDSTSPQLTRQTMTIDKDVSLALGMWDFFSFVFHIFLLVCI